MPLRDDNSLTEQQYQQVRKEAERALEAADALGVFPTPVSQVMEAAGLQEAPSEALDASFLKKMRKKAGSALKRALAKVIGLFDARARLIFVDGSLYPTRKTFVRLHETGHGVLPWQREIYAVVEDCEKTLSPEVADLFDREANVFASEVLFQVDRFAQEADQLDFGVRTPLRLSKKYGASVYASLRQYVRKSHRACALLVLNPPDIAAGVGFRATLRRREVSAEFYRRFGHTEFPKVYTPDDEIGRLIPLGQQRLSPRHALGMDDRNGEVFTFHAETFSTGYQVFVLLWAKEGASRRVVLPAH